MLNRTTNKGVDSGISKEIVIADLISDTVKKGMEGIFFSKTLSLQLKGTHLCIEAE